MINKVPDGRNVDMDNEQSFSSEQEASTSSSSNESSFHSAVIEQPRIAHTRQFQTSTQNSQALLSEPATIPSSNLHNASTTNNQTRKYNPELQYYKRRRDFIIEQYSEESEIYRPEQYGDNLSDDDISILAPEAKGSYRTKIDKDGTRIIVKTVDSSSTEQSDSSIRNSHTSQSTQSESNSNQSSPPSQRSKRAPLIDIEKGPGYEEPLDLGSDEQYQNCDRIKYLLAKIELEKQLARDRPKKSFKEKVYQGKSDFIEFVKNPQTWNWFVMGPVITLIVFICIFFPVAQRNDLFGHHDPTLRVHEHISDYIYPTLGAIRTSLVDPDSPPEAMTKLNKDGEEWELVFSDEFNAEGRTFYPHMDQFWEAVDLNYAATNDLEWYDPDAASTVKGSLNIRMDNIKQHNLNYRSAMLQSWNKLCFTEGFLEISAKLPGSAHTAGLWPGLWTLGNLARPGYMASTEGVWPYSYNECDAGITANQSSPDGISHLPGQKLNKCLCKGADHPNPGTGRGAPEIDILEGAHASGAYTSGVASQTLQVAPFDIWYLPDYEFVEVYNQSKSNIAHFLGTPYQEMLSTLTTINDTWYQNVVDPEKPQNRYDDVETHFQKYSVEYRSKMKKRADNYCRFFVGDEPSSTVYASALHPNGNIGWRDLPKEPMSIILNLGLSPSWSMIQYLNIVFPVIFEIDYVRIYQPKGLNQMTCDPKDYPTYDYIQSHLNAYMNPNLTSWEAAGYTFPKNKLTSKC